MDRPMPFDTLPVLHSFKIRYAWTSGNSLSTTLSPTQLIQSWFCTYDSSTTVMSIVQSLRFKYAEMWIGSAGGGIFTPQTAALGWEAETTFGRDQIKQDLSITASQAAHVLLRPLKGTASAQWQSTQSTQPWNLIIAGSQGAILDLCCDVLLNASPLSATNNSFKTVTATPGVGICYFINLQVNAAPTLTLSPQSVVTIS